VTEGEYIMSHRSPDSSMARVRVIFSRNPENSYLAFCAEGRISETPTVRFGGHYLGSHEAPNRETRVIIFVHTQSFIIFPVSNS
jgi:hypothetical protein